MGQDVPKFERKKFLKLPTHRHAYSDRAALLMAKMSQLAYVDDAEALTAALGQAGFSLVAIFNNKETQGFLAHGEDFNVLSFRGTEGKKEDILTDINLFPRFKKGLIVHGGFREAYDHVASDVKKAVDSVKGSIYVTGHSLGGALALIACAELGASRISACYTFGAPRPGDKHFDKSAMKVPVYRVVNGRDLVARVPLFPYQATGEVTYLNSKGERFRGPAAIWRSFASGAVAGLAGLVFRAFFFIQWSSTLRFVTDHFLDGYVTKLEKIAAERDGDIPSGDLTFFRVSVFATTFALLAAIISSVVMIFWAAWELLGEFHPGW